MRVLLGIALIGVGLLKHSATPLIVIGAVVGLLGIASMVGSTGRGRDAGEGQEPR
jgi:hypothetical protein